MGKINFKSYCDLVDKLNYIKYSAYKKLPLKHRNLVLCCLISFAKLLKYMMFKYTTDGRKCQLILHWKRGLKYFFSCLHKIYSQKCMYKPQLPKCWVASILQDLIINLQIVKLKDTGATEIPPLAPELFNREIAFYYLPMTSLNTLRAFL